LNNGVEMPALGLGVFQTPPAETAGAVEAAIEVGYRLIDAAAAYMNEREVGEGIRRSGIERNQIFVETKLWITDYGYDTALHAFGKSARKLGVGQIDLLLLHHALSSAFDRTLDAYRALETLLGDGKVRAIGVSNFMPEHLNRLLAEAPPSCPPSTRSRSTPPSSRPRCGVCTPSTASPLRHGRPSAASPPTEAVKGARSTTRRCLRSRPGTASRPLR
jgi:diketogulonate reductase-like aldo/keto reductase